MSGFWTSSLEPPGDVASSPSLWGPYDRYVRPYLAHALLACSTVASVLHLGVRVDVLALAAAACLWVLLTDTLLPAAARRNGWLCALSFAGLLTFAVLLMQRDPVFLVFMVSCFFHALRLRPVPLAVLGLAVTSLLINTIAAGGPVKALREDGFVFVAVVLVQTGAIAGGSVVSRKLSEQNEARRKALSELEAALEENAGLQRQLLAQAREAGVLDERQRLSREIHDTLAQGLTGIITQLEAAEESADWRRHLGNALGLARENLGEARRSVHALRPALLAEGQLTDALRGVAARWSARNAVRAEFTATGTQRPLHPEIEATLLRLTQEALSNVARHANAERVGITVSYMEDQVTLDVRDDGRGFDPAGITPGYGLSGMRQRAARLMGTVTVESEPGGGTAVSASLPALDLVAG